MTQPLPAESAGGRHLNDEELAANQLQVDSILGTINRIAGSTAFQGAKLLNGNYAYTTSGAAASAFSTMQINAARLPDGQAVNVVVQVTDSATTGLVSFTGAGTGAANAVTLEIAGNAGTEQLSFAGSSTIAQIATAVNAIKEVTGVSAADGGGAAGGEAG